MSTAYGTPRQLLVTSLAGILAGILLWSLVVTLFDPPAFLLPDPTSVATQLTDHPNLYFDATVATTQKIIVGGGLGIILGFIAGTAIGLVPLLRTILLPYLIALRVLPKIAVAPVLLIYFGLGYQTAIIYVILVAFFPMTITTAAGYQRLPTRHHDLARSVAAGPLTTFLRVRLPYALIDVFAGLKQTVALAVVGAIIAEWVVSTSGLGYLILIAAESVQTASVLAALIVLFALGFSLYGSVALLQRAVPFQTT